MYDHINHNCSNKIIFYCQLCQLIEVYTRRFLYLYMLYQQDIKYRKMSFTIGFKNAFGIEILET